MDTDATTAAAPEAPTFRYTRDRFPLVTCHRCLGTGTYSRCATWGTTCFQCGVRPGEPGTGLALASAKVRAIYAEWDEARRAAKTVVSCDLQVGDVIAVERDTLRQGPGKGRIWATVTSITRRPGPHLLALRASDGREATHEEHPGVLLDRKGHVDPRPYAARAWASLSRRQRAEVVNPEAEAAASASA
jgi:hypothetical protein